MKELTDYNYILTLIRQQDFHFSKALGQNFLTDKTVITDIVEAASPDKNTGVLEIGPGIGTLTVAIAAKAQTVLAIERDEKLQTILQTTLADSPNVHVVFKDALQMDISEISQSCLNEKRRIVCANIPYSITTPLITKLLRAGCFSELILMVQKEVANRICASVGTKSYGAFTLLCQWYAECSILRVVPAKCFIPRPKVDSAIIIMRVRKEAPYACDNTDMLFRIIRSAFEQRRKTLVNALHAKFPKVSKQEICNILHTCRLPDDIRGEKLNLQEFVAISEEMTKCCMENL